MMLGTMGAGCDDVLGNAGFATPAKVGRAGIQRCEGESCGDAVLCCNEHGMAVHRM